MVRTGPLLWQGLFIVAPAVLLAGIGLVFLHQNQRLAEQEIRARATRFAEDLALVRLPNALWGDLPPYDPDDRSRPSVVSLERDPILGLAGRKLPRVAAVVDVNGRLIFPRPIETGTTPHPLDVGKLDADLRGPWHKWAAERNSTSSPPATVSGVKRLFPRELPPEFAAAVEYRLGLDSEVEGRIEEARQHYETIIDRFPNILSESGIPRRTFAGLHLLQAVSRDGPVPPRYRGLVSDMAVDAVLSPSVLSDSILERLKVIEGEPSEATDKARRVWSAHETARALFQDYAALKRAQTAGAPEWMVWNTGPSFLVMQARDPKSRWVLFMTEDSVRRACIECLASAAIPTYFRVAVDVAGRAVAEAPESGPQVGTANTSDRPEGPVPTIRVRVFLTDAREPYAQLHAQAAWIRAIIVLSMVAVVSGFAFALRSFLRQRQLAEMQGNFVSSVSHELRAPIASIRLMAEELVATAPPGGANDYHGLIVQECRRLSNLIENVLDYSRHERGGVDYRFESTDVLPLVEDAAQLMRNHAAEKGISIKTRTPGEPLTAEVDAKTIMQALINLIDNAIKYSPSGSEVLVGAEADAASAVICLWVEDHGVGIPPEEHERIFERFYRSGSELRRETKGVGLGLAIVKQVATAHRGRVVVRSVSGQGSHFTLELPVRAAKASGNT